MLVGEHALQDENLGTAGRRRFGRHVVNPPGGGGHFKLLCKLDAAALERRLIALHLQQIEQQTPQAHAVAVGISR